MIKRPRRLVVNCKPGQLRDERGRCGPGIGVDIPRPKMPQIAGDDLEAFKAFITSKGVSLKEEEVKAETLAPTQKSFRQDKVDKLPHSDNPILVSEDHYILDGTHRWVKAWQKSKDASIKVLRVGLPLRRALELMGKFPKVSYALNSLTINPFVSEAQRRACYAADDPRWDCSEWSHATGKKKLPKRKAEVHNSFCPTGEGGGVDPTCSAGGAPVEFNHYSQWGKSLNPKQADAIEDYVGPSYEEINSLLRSDKWSTSSKQTTIRNITRAIESAPPTPHDTEVYRGVDASFLPSLKVGNEIEDKGFCSTAVDRADAESFAGASGGVLHIKVPKGTRAAFIDAVVKYRDEDAPSENELLLNRGSRFKVVARSKDKSGRTNVFVELMK